MYPLDQGLWGATARISQLRDILATMTVLDVIEGYRGPRRTALLRYLFSGRLRGLDGIYVETSSTLPSELDLAFLALARLLGIPVLTYIRDAQYLFDEYYPVTSLRRRVARALFLPAVSLLRRVSSRTGYPSVGLARAVRDPVVPPLLLPPGSPPPVRIPRRADARSLLFVGAMRYEAHGLALLTASLERIRAMGHDLRVICVSRPGEEPPEPWPAWMRVERGSGADIHPLLPEVLATLQPRLRTPYNDLAVPIKVMEYLSYQRPLVVTDCTEQARIVTDAAAGLVVPDTVEGMTSGLLSLLAAEPAMIDAWSANAAAAAERNSWGSRGERILSLVTGTSGD